jgi:hypothetical protein
MATHVRGRYSSFVVPGRPFCQPHPQGTECEENASLAGFLRFSQNGGRCDGRLQFFHAVGYLLVLAGITLATRP